MPKDVRVIVLRTAGTNCDGETAFAFKTPGATVDLVHVNRLLEKDVRLGDYHILAIPGGFTYGDDIISGRILANELRLRLGEEVAQFIAAGKLVIGICNGFQVLVRAGILSGYGAGAGEPRRNFVQDVSLTYNDSGKFEDRWVHLRVAPKSKSVWTAGLPPVMYVPVAHAEGKFVPRDRDLLRRLDEQGQIVFRYSDAQGNDVDYPQNPNGSVDDVAGICDPTGRVLGLMPHPERHFLFTQHPFWTRLNDRRPYGEGARIFENGINYVRENLL